MRSVTRTCVRITPYRGGGQQGGAKKVKNLSNESPERSEGRAEGELSFRSSQPKQRIRPLPLASDDSCKLYCMTTTQGLKKHAKKFGIEGVAETAAELGFSVDELADLIEWLDEEEYTQLKSVAKQFTPDKKRHRKTYEQRAKDLLGITDPEEEAENAD